MDTELVNKISNLAIASYYNPRLKLAVVHFFNKDEDKNDIIAYLKHDMSWDVREIINEECSLDKGIGFLGEKVKITHSPIDTFSHGSKFDKFIRSYINNLISNSNVNMIDSRVKDILDDNSYEDVLDNDQYF